MVKDVAKLIIKLSIYPTKTESRGAVEGYLVKNNPQFFNKFSEENWLAYYNTNIRKFVSSFWYSILGFLNRTNRYKC